MICLYTSCCWGIEKEILPNVLKQLNKYSCQKTKTREKVYNNIVKKILYNWKNLDLLYIFGIKKSINIFEARK